MINCKKIFSCLFALMLVFSYSTIFTVYVVNDAYAAGEKGSSATATSGSTSDTTKTNDGYSSACKGNKSDGIFSSLVCTGRLLFEDLRELIYIVAGFGIIAVGVGGIFGNLNWKWLGAIIISLVIIATAGELISVMLGDAHGIKNEYSADAVQASLQE